MKTKTKFTIACASVLTMSAALPAFAAPLALSDAQLDSVSGKAGNLATVGGANTTSITGLQGVAGSIQVGYYQWADNHSSDTSQNKGGNIQSGNFSMVQQHAAVAANQIAWGGASDSITNNVADIGGEQVMESWWIMYLGGF